MVINIVSCQKIFLTRKPIILFLVLFFSFAQATMVFANQSSSTRNNFIGIAEPAWLLKIKDSAESGNADSQISLGKMYRSTVCLDEAGGPMCFDTDKVEGVHQNHFEAVRWFKLAAEQGNAEGQYELGFMYQHGFGIRQNYLEALKYYKLSAAQGYGDAQLLLGGMYEEGYGVKKNYSIAKEWYGKACDNHNKGGCFFYKKLNKKGY